MKTRTNQPVVEYEVDDITKISDTLLNQLQCGDRVSKITGEQKHNYIVTYKQEKHGICLSYYDGSGYIETISYDYTDGHWVYNSKDVFEGNKLENITDKDGHERFIEGDITPNEISGVTFTYAKWSLSGTHLLIVLAGNIANGTELSSATWVDSINVPQWIKDKIYVTFSSVIDMKVVQTRASNWSYQDVGFTFNKLDNVIYINCFSTITINDDRGFRLAFDLLIDNE